MEATEGTSVPVVHVVDDDESLRTAITRLLRAAGFAVHAHASATEFLLGARADVPSCVVLDIRMPGPSGLDLQEALARSDEPLPVVFLTGYGDVAMSVRAMKSGAVDFLTKPVTGRVLLSAVRNALARDGERRAARDRLRTLHSCYETLTPREREVFTQVVAGKLNKQVAAALLVSERTVKAHRAQVMKKMQVESLAELVRVADMLRPLGPLT